MKKSFILSLLCMGFVSYAQVGIGTTTPRGALDINQPTTNDAGLVLPTNSNVANIINPQTNGAPVPGTIMYDSTQDCVRLYTNAWSNCIGQQGSSGGSGSGRGAMLGTSGNSGDGTTQSWLLNLTDRTKFGPSGTYNGPIMWASTYSNSSGGGGFATEDMDSGAEIYSKYNILHLSSNFNTSFFRGYNDQATTARGLLLANKLKEYVNSGGVLFIGLNQPYAYAGAGRQALVQELFREYMGFDLVYTATRYVPNAQDVIITDNPVNNGPFGDQRNARFFPQYTSPWIGPELWYAPITVSSLPVGSEVYLWDTQNQEPLVFATGPDNRVIFFFSEQLTAGVGNGTAPQDIIKTNFMYNQVVNLIEKTN